MAWFEVRGGNHVKPTFSRLSAWSFLAPRLKGKRRAKGPASAPSPSCVLTSWRCGTRGFAPFLPAFHTHRLASSPASGSVSPSLPRWFFYSDCEHYHGKGSRGFSFAVPSGVHCSLPPPHKLSRLHPLLVAWGSGQMAGHIPGLMDWLISSQLKPRHGFYETVLWQAEVTLNKAESQRSLSWVSEQNLAKSPNKGRRWSGWRIWCCCCWSEFSCIPVFDMLTQGTVSP